MIPEVQYLSPWDAQYSPDITPVTNRTGSAYGRVRQNQRTNRFNANISVSRTFTGNNADAMLLFFEGFMFSQCRGGTDWFKDAFLLNGSVVSNVKMRLKGGYSVESDGVTHVVKAAIEVPQYTV